jgi:hypothetical protein
MYDRRSGTIQGAALALVYWLAAPPLAGQIRQVTAESFGILEASPYWVLAEEFEPIQTEVAKGSLHPGCLFQSSGQVKAFHAPLHLPHGARIASLRAYYYDNSPLDLTVSLDYVEWTENPDPDFTVVGDVQSAGTPRYASAFVNLNHTLNNFPAGALGDGERSYDLTLTLPPTDLGANEFLALCGIRILWRRTVSPAPQAATFDDVPANHAQFQYIEALAAAGISVGCGNGNYCPDNPLTRGQMAVFLAKALGLHWAAP